ncbi:RNA ligase [Halorhabdus tiamatea]|uniref:ATP-dependent DNA ligase n=1 Tax=Halorhabdus tiamatea SARL4B TaxID=1033806 RepID=F7PR29_9EURY|nr:RNA ligase [Halorhabdus tiamatea]CCQ33725.1 ATP-dependent DNA ligase [Halorhabdus tiamatea SARL4B]
MGDDRDWATVLGVPDEDREDILGAFDASVFEGRRYRHLTDARHGIERGTAIVDGRVVRGFPSIPRTLVLDPGIAEHFDGRLTVEEKRNGYNVRVARIDGDVLGFTRGGYICPYTTSKVRELLDPDSFFEAHPGLMLCGELIGPENPYTPHEYPEVESAAFEVFDIRDRESGRPLAVDRRREFCERHDLAMVPNFGEYDPAEATDAVREVIGDLDREGKEGVVLQSMDGTRQLKYTTSATHRADLEHAFSLPFDYGRDFVFPRILREVFQAVELDRTNGESRQRAQELGEAILLPAIEAVRAVERGETVGEDHTVRGDPDAIEALLSHLREMGITLEIQRDRRVGDERAVSFVKVSQATRDNVENYLDGQLIDE